MFKHTPKCKSFILLTVILIVFKPSFSQIQGSVLDMKKQPLSFANVLLLNNKDSSIVSGVMAGEEGTYNLTNFKPGNYILGVKMLGYISNFSEPFEIINSNTHLHNAPIFLEESSFQMDDVDIIVKKPIYELKIDRMVVNVENSITSSGNTALEVLEKSPGVIVDRQNYGISLSGKSGVMVMINGKQNRMPIDAAVQMLDAMSADNVKKIELITTPPSKYDAEGNAGIINIVLKKNEAIGTNGSLSLVAGMANKEKFSGSLNINHHTGKVNIFGAYSPSYDNKYQLIEMYRREQKDGSEYESNTESIRDARLMYQDARLGLDYTVSSKTVVGILFEGRIRHWTKGDFNSTEYKKDQQLTSSSEMNVTGFDKWIHGIGNVNLQHHFKEDEILDVNFDYLHYENENPTHYIIDNYDEQGIPLEGEEIDIKKATPINFYVGMIDYSNQFNDKIKLETGAKITVSNFLNNVEVSYLNSGVWEIDDELSNEYAGDENILALYSTLNYKLNENTSFVGGLRYEYLNSVLNSVMEKGIVDLHYGKLFPTLYFSHKLNTNNTLQLSYGRRIDRPTFNELAPFITFITPEILFAGNEKLLPAFSNLFKVDYQFKTIMVSFSFTDTQDAISRFQPTWSEDETKIYYVSQNLDNQKTVSAMLAFPVKVTDWWNMRYNFNWLYQNLKTDYEGENLEREINTYNINSVQSFTISKRISSEILGLYNSGSLSGVSKIKGRGKIDVGVQMKFKNEQSRLSFNVSDILKTYTRHFSTDIPELNIYTKTFLDFEPRVAKLTFTHNFGNTKTKASRIRNTASEEERKRIQN